MSGRNVKHWRLAALLSCAIVMIGQIVVADMHDYDVPGETVIADNTVSRPVGFVRVEVPAEGRVAASIPFEAFDPTLAEIFERQLSGPTNVYGEYRILQWDRQSQTYTMATKLHGPDENLVRGTWLSDVESAVPSDMTLMPGSAFWIEGHSDQPRFAFLWGDLPLEESVIDTLYPGMNFLGSPYPSVVSLDSNSPLALPASGYWYQLDTDETLDLEISRPYADVFPSSGLPVIVDMHINEECNEIGLEIACSGEEGERLEILFKDLDPTNALDTAAGWKLADTLPPSETELPEDADADQWLTVGWTDGGVGKDRRGKVNEVFGRIYMAGRSDIDTDRDGIPDCRESFIYGTAPDNRDTDGDGLSDAEELKYGTDPL